MRLIANIGRKIIPQEGRRSLIGYKRSFAISTVRSKLGEIESGYMRSIQGAGLNTTGVGPEETGQKSNGAKMTTLNN